MDGSNWAMTVRGKYNSLVFPISSVGNVVPPVLHITLGIVLKMFSMLAEHAKGQDSVSNEKECV